MEIQPLFIPRIVTKIHIYKSNVRTCNIHNNTVTSHVLRTAQRLTHNPGIRSIMDQEHDDTPQHVQWNFNDVLRDLTFLI